MKMIIFLLMMCVVSPALACSRCGNFVNCTYQVQAAAPIVINNVDVQLRHLRFVDQRKPPTQAQIATALAYKRQWQMVIDAIPIAPPIDQRKLFKEFRFQNKLIAKYQQPEPIKNAGYQKVVFARKTKALRALISFKTEINQVNLIQSGVTTTTTTTATPSRSNLQTTPNAAPPFPPPAPPASPAPIPDPPIPDPPKPRISIPSGSGRLLDTNGKEVFIDP